MAIVLSIWVLFWFMVMTVGICRNRNTDIKAGLLNVDGHYWFYEYFLPWVIGIVVVGILPAWAVSGLVNWWTQ